MQVLDATGSSTPGIGRIHISTCCVKDDLCALGGFNGEVVVKDMRRTDSSAVQRCVSCPFLVQTLNACLICSHAGKLMRMACFG